LRTVARIHRIQTRFAAEGFLNFILFRGVITSLGVPSVQRPVFIPQLRTWGTLPVNF
jgi:hypothetical protein